jgi:hypothetical protein
MKYCKSCNVSYNTPLEHCILCNGELENKDGHEHELVYKYGECKKKSRSRFFLRLFLFLNVISAVIALYVDYITSFELSWSLVVAITNFYAVIMFIVLTIPTIWTSKLSKSIIITAGGLILIGLSIRDYSWAIDYVLPISLMTNIFLISILIVVNKKKWFDYFSSLAIISIIGLLPGLFVLLNWTVESLPSLICFYYSIITIIGMIVLPSKNSREEFKRRFHI